MEKNGLFSPGRSFSLLTREGWGGSCPHHDHNSKKRGNGGGAKKKKEGTLFDRKKAAINVSIP